MNTANATPTTLLPSARAARHGAAFDAPAESLRRRTTDGYVWLCREGYADLLERIPASAWNSLDGRDGLTRVKENADRQVWRVRRPGGDVYAKISFVDGPLARFKRLLRGPACRSEWRAADYARRFGIAAVEPVACAFPGRLGGARCLIVTAAVPNAVPLNEYWQTLQPLENGCRRRRIDRLITAVAGLIAGAHQAGFRHVDLHPENLLVARDPVSGEMARVVFVDLQNVRIGRPVSDRDVVRSLAQLNQWFRRHASVTDRIRFLRRYLRVRAEVQGRSPHGRPIGLSLRGLVEALDEQARRHADRIYAKRDRRAMRSSRYFARVRLGAGWSGHVFLCAKHAVAGSHASTLCFRKEQWRRWLASPEALTRFDGGAQVLKDSHSGRVVRRELPVEGGSLAVVCKRPLARNLRRRLSMALGRSRAVRTWRLGNALLHRELPTARPLAVLVRRRLGLVLDSVVVTEALPGACDLDEFLSHRLPRYDGPARRRAKDRLIRAVCELTKRLHARGFAHRDFKAGNLMLQWDDSLAEPPRLSLVDLDGLALVRQPVVGHLHQAIARLSVSCEPYPVITRTDRVRFLKALAEGWGCDVDAWRPLWRKIAPLCDDIRRRHETHRRWKLENYGRE